MQSTILIMFNLCMSRSLKAATNFISKQPIKINPRPKLILHTKQTATSQTFCLTALEKKATYGRGMQRTSALLAI